MRLEIKIEYNPGKFIKLFREVEKESYRFQNLILDVKSNCPGFTDLTVQTIRVRFQDEDGDFINLTENDERNFEEMLLQAKFVEERNVRKIVLKVSELDSPLPGKLAGKRRKIDESERVNLQPRTLKFASNKSSKRVNRTDTAEDCCEDNGSPVRNYDSKEEVVSTVGKSTSAMERYIEIAVINFNKQTAKLDQLRREKDEVMQKLEAASLVAGDKSTIVCGNCHLRLGHTQKKCTLERCTDVFLCGQEKQHPGQINKRKMDQAIAKQEKLVSECEAELKRRKTAVQSVEKSKTKQIENRLLENQEEYSNELGNLNWNLVRKHATMIEHYCKKNMNGRIPGKEAIPEILRKAKQDFDAICGKVVTRAKQKKKHRGNLSRNVLEEHGVLFPNETDDYDSDSSDDSSHLAKPDLIRAVPKNKEEKTSQLEMAMQASMITSNRQQVTGNDYNFPVIQSEYNFPSQGQYANFNLVPQPQYNLYNVPAQYNIGAPHSVNMHYVHDRLYHMPVPFVHAGVNYNFDNEEAGVHNDGDVSRTAVTATYPSTSTVTTSTETNSSKDDQGMQNYSDESAAMALLNLNTEIQK